MYSYKLLNRKAWWVMKNCILGNFRNNSQTKREWAIQKLNSTKSKIKWFWHVLSYRNGMSPFAVYRLVLISESLESAGPLVIPMKDFYTSLLLSCHWCFIWTGLYFNKIIKKFIIINGEKESTRPTSSNIGWLFAFKWRYWSCLYLGQWIWNRLQVMGSFSIILR